MSRSIKKVRLKDLTFGDGKIYIQSMLNTRSDDIDGSVAQAAALETAGCEIIRLAIPDMAAISLIPAIKKQVGVPLVADIHFDYRLALAAADAGIDKIRINPGNIGSEDRVRQVAERCKAGGIPIRIGVNSGSLEKDILEKYGSPTAEALVESSLRHASLLTKYNFDDIVISIKSSDVRTMIEGYRLLSRECSYPLHLGVTEAGTEHMGIIKSSIGIGSLLADGIGETIRVSLTADPVCEVYAAIDLLRALGIRRGVNLISCPTCGRTRIDIVGLADRIEKALKDVDKDITVAVMGCAVNGPGEAREADIGIAGGDGCALLFKKGVIVRKLAEEEILPQLLEEISAM